MPHIVARAPVVLHSRAGRFTIDMKNDRILFLRIKLNGFDHPAIQHHRTNIYFEKFLWTETQFTDTAFQFLVIGHQFDFFMGAQVDQ